MQKYKTFEEWFDELESFSQRSDRFYEEWETGQIDAKRALEWIRAAWNCAREESCPYCSDPSLSEVFFDQTCPCCVERMNRFADKIK